MLIGLILGKHSIQKCYNYTININSFILKTRFVNLKGVCMQFTCDENRTLLTFN